MALNRNYATLQRGLTRSRG